MYVYRFLNTNNEVIYIGRSKDLKNRISSHNHLSEDCYKEIDRIEYIKCLNDDESSIYERYYINILNPKYNSQYKNNSEFSFELPEKEWKLYNKRLFDYGVVSFTKERIDLSDADLGKLLRITQQGLIINNIIYNNNKSYMTKWDIKEILQIEIKAVEQFLKRLIDKEIIIKSEDRYSIAEFILLT